MGENLFKRYDTKGEGRGEKKDKKKKKIKDSSNFPVVLEWTDPDFAT